MDAFARVRALFSVRKQDWNTLYFQNPRILSVLQDYILNPVEENWARTLDYWRSEQIESRKLASFSSLDDTLDIQEHCRIFETANRKLFQLEERRLSEIVQVGAVLGVQVAPIRCRDLLCPLPAGSRQLSDSSLNQTYFWGQPFFQNGSTDRLRAKVYRSKFLHLRSLTTLTDHSSRYI